MHFRHILLTAALLTPLPTLGIGYVYTGVGDDGRQHLELTSVTVEVRIDERVARTRTDQIFTNHAEWEVEGIYEFTLPEGAIITDLVLWIGDTRVQGLIMEKEEARRVYDDIVRQRIDPALIEQVTPNQFRLSIFPFPAKGSRRVEFEYMQLLDARNGRIDYTFPLAPETDQALQMELFVLRAHVRSQHAFEATTSGLPRLTEVGRPDAHTANVFYGDEDLTPREDFTLSLQRTGDLDAADGAQLRAGAGRGPGLLRLVAAAAAGTDRGRSPAPQPDLRHRHLFEHAAGQAGGGEGGPDGGAAEPGGEGPVQHRRLQPPGRCLRRGAGAGQPVEPGVGGGLHQPAGRAGGEQLRGGSGKSHAAGLSRRPGEPRHLPHRRPAEPRRDRAGAV